MLLNSILRLVCVLTLMVSFGVSAVNDDQAINSLRSTSKAFADVAKRVSPSVVNIQVEQEISNSRMYYGGMPYGGDEQELDPFSEDILRFFFGHPHHDSSKGKHKIIGQGSGFIISESGHIVTNYHVIKDASKINVKLLDGRDYVAEKVGVDPKSDIAVIKIEDKKLPVAKLGDSDKLEVGEWVLAVGNPFGLTHTLTAGIVSAKGRYLEGITDYENFIQTDAAVNPGNSGGPLADLNGEVVAMNTAIASRTGGYLGISFAIPVNMIKTVSDQLITHGSVIRGHIGVRIQEFTPDLAKSFNMKDTKGVLVAQLEDDAPAQKAGVKQGDIITHFNDTQVDDPNRFRNLVSMHKPGTIHKLTVIRGGITREIKVKIGNLDAAVAKENEPTDANNIEKFGMTLSDITPELAKYYGLGKVEGVVAVKVERDSLASRAGIRPGTAILEVNRKKIKNITDFKTSVVGFTGTGVIALLLKDSRTGIRYVTIKID